MAPQGTHQASRNRAERAWQLRCAGATWQSIADQLGFKSRSSATNAVNRLLAKDPPDSAVMERRQAAGGYRIVQQKLFATLATTKDPHAVVAVSRAITDVTDRRAKLLGLHVMVPQEINLHVQQSASAVLDRAEQELLALTDGRAPAAAAPLPVLDVEAVEVSS
jgi:hypothetical protein